MGLFEKKCSLAAQLVLFQTFVSLFVDICFSLLFFASTLTFACLLQEIVVGEEAEDEGAMAMTDEGAMVMTDKEVLVKIDATTTTGEDQPVG